MSAALAPTLLARCRGHGDPVVRRVYGDVARLGGWQTVPGFRLIHAGNGKNAADMLLCIEAMALLQGKPGATLVIASSDGDFSHLATHLRENGVRVIGIGEAKAPPQWRQACSLFCQIGPAHPTTTTAPPPAPVKAAAVAAPIPDENKVQPSPAELAALNKVTALLQREAPSGALPLSRLGLALPGLIKQTGHQNWSKLLRAHPSRFRVEMAAGSGGTVRLI